MGKIDPTFFDNRAIDQNTAAATPAFFAGPAVLLPGTAIDSLQSSADTILQSEQVLFYRRLIYVFADYPARTISPLIKYLISLGLSASPT